jgi:hypothetical protein
MGKIILYISAILILCGCNGLEYKYHIVGKVILKDSTLRNSEWFTDTISFDFDTAFYKNSDGSVVKIYPPYTVYEIKNETNN